MKSNQRYLILGALFAASLSARAVPVLFPNGDFEIGFLDSWTEFSGNGGTYYFYDESTGGNPDGYGVIDHDEDDGGYGILVSNSNTPIPIASIGTGLEVGRTYTFSQDMIILPGFITGLPGSNIGGLKVDFYSGTTLIGNSGDLRPSLINGGTSWETYTFNVTIPSGTDGIAAVLLWGDGSVTGFDNVQVDDTPLPAPTSIPNGDFEIAAGDSWGNNSDGGTFNISFPAGPGGGNPDGYARIEDVTASGGFAVLVSNSDVMMPLSELGLDPGESYKFSQDMKIFSGSNLGALKVDFFNGDGLISSTGSQTPALIGTGATWETYDFEVSIPINATGIKVVAVAGAASDVGFDNVTYDPTPLVVAPLTEIPNGDFEIAGGADWFSDSGFGDTFTFSYPASGGNPGGYGVIDHSAPNTGFGVMVTNTNAVIPLSGLGLTPGQAYTFSQDMKIFAGSNIGGLKVEFYNLGTKISDTGDLRIPVISPGTSWHTYDYDVSIPLGVDGVKLVCLWGSASVVGFDNVTFSSTPVVVPPIPNAGFELGNAGWAFYQANTSASFPSTLGNPNGHARMNNSGSGYGVLVANGNAILSLTGLGISAGETVTFRQDMRLFSGSNIGKFKLEFYNGAAKISESEKLTSLIGDGSTWETYTYDFLIPIGTNGVKVVLVAGIGSDVGYDNIGIGAPPANDFTSWIGGYPGVGGLTGFNDDPDHDGNNNGMENFFGTDPSASSSGLTAGTVTGNTFVFTHPQNASPASDMSAPVYRWSTDLQTFHADGASNGGGTTTVSFSTAPNTPSAGNTTVTATITGTVIPATLFVNVSVTLNP